VKKFGKKNRSYALLIMSSLIITFFLTSYSSVSAVLLSSKRISTYGAISYYGASIPLLGGWGGIRLFEVNRFTGETNDASRTEPPSIVFPSEVASNTEMAMRKMKEVGYNAVRVMFEGPLLETRPEWGWNDAWFQKTLAIAEALKLWLIVDYHGYYDVSRVKDEWIAWWRDNLISKYKNAYDKLIWEPINEPVMEGLEGQDAVDALALAYQEWVDMCRGLGDTHWIVVSCVCWWNSLPEVDWFPTVTDALNKTFLNRHFYYFYEWNMDRWTVEQAQAQADHCYQVIVQAIQKYNRPFLTTEMGADYGVIEPPDARYEGASSYSPTSLAFVQRIITNFDSHPGRIGYILWPAGDWAKDWPGGENYTGLYGGMNTWGTLLTYETFA